jgi:hypothetical protein
MKITSALRQVIRSAQPARQVRSHAGPASPSHFPGRGIVWASHASGASRSGPQARAYASLTHDDAARPRATKVSAGTCFLSGISRRFEVEAQRRAYNAIVKDLFPDGDERRAYLSTRTDDPKMARFHESLAKLRQVACDKITKLDDTFAHLNAAEQLILEKRREHVTAYEELRALSSTKDVEGLRAEHMGHIAKTRTQHQGILLAYDDASARSRSLRQILACIDALPSRLAPANGIWTAEDSPRPVIAIGQGVNSKVL